MVKLTKQTGEFKEKALELIALHIGDVTAAMYVELYRKRNADFILQSVRALMVELLGEEKAKRELLRVSLTRQK